MDSHLTNSHWTSGCNGPIHSGMRPGVSPNGTLCMRACSTLSPPGDLVLHKSTARQRVVRLQIIVVYTTAREAIPQPTPQPNTSKEIRTCLLIRACDPCRTQTFFLTTVGTRVSPIPLHFFACLSLMSNRRGQESRKGSYLHRRDSRRARSLTTVSFPS